MLVKPGGQLTGIVGVGSINPELIFQVVDGTVQVIPQYRGYWNGMFFTAPSEIWSAKANSAARQDRSPYDQNQNRAVREACMQDLAK